LDYKLLYREESYEIIGACIDVHKELGPGFHESVYQEALEIELENRRVPFIREAKLGITYKGKLLQKEWYADFLCYNKIIIELKAIDSLSMAHKSQLINYLKATNIQLGLLINFGQKSLVQQRVVRTFR
jgi:GxxExxY protein